MLAAGGRKRWVTLEAASLTTRVVPVRERPPTTRRCAPASRDRRNAQRVRREWFRARAATLRPATLDRSTPARTRSASRRRSESIRLDELTRERLEAWLGELVERDPAHRAVEQVDRDAQSDVSTAVEWERLAVNPALRLRMPKRAESETAAVERVLTPEQVERMHRRRPDTCAARRCCAAPPRPACGSVRSSGCAGRTCCSRSDASASGEASGRRRAASASHTPRRVGQARRVAISSRARRAARRVLRRSR